MAPAVEAFTTNNKVIRQDLVVANVLILMSVAPGMCRAERRGFKPRSVRKMFISFFRYIHQYHYNFDYYYVY